MNLLSPVKKIFVTQIFGVNPANYAKFGLKGHNGIDFRAFIPNGERCYEGGKSEVFAPHDGKVLENLLDVNGYGWYVKLESDKEGSILAHFSSQSPCKVGSTVKQGQFIGYQGTTGNSSGIHLHWGYYKIPRDRSNGFNGYINQAGLYSLQSNQEPNMNALLTYLGVDSEKSALEKLDEHLGTSNGKCDWGTDNEGKGGHLGAARRRVKQLESSTGISLKQEIEVAGKKWILNGLQVDSTGKVVGNYAQIS